MGHILLTGAAGFIGARTASMLLENGHKVTGIDNMNDYYPIELKEYRIEELGKHDNFSFFRGDIENYDYLRLLFETNKFSAVINLAARAGVRYSEENPFVYLSTNVKGTLNLLDLMKKYGTKKIVLASTSSVYAGESIPFSEDAPANKPISQYAATKKAAEDLAYTYHNLYDIDVSICRYFTVYGPAGRPDMSIYRFIKAIIEKQPIIIFGDGNHSRDFTFVDDIARGTVAALKNIGYEIINLGGGHKPYRLKEVISIIEELSGEKAIIEYRPEHKTDLTDTMADISKAKRILDWEPEIDLLEGLEKSISWYIKNRNWLINI